MIIRISCSSLFSFLMLGIYFSAWGNSIDDFMNKMHSIIFIKNGKPGYCNENTKKIGTKEQCDLIKNCEKYISDFKNYKKDKSFGSMREADHHHFMKMETALQKNIDKFKESLKKFQLTIVRVPPETTLTISFGAKTISFGAKTLLPPIIKQQNEPKYHQYLYLYLCPGTYILRASHPDFRPLEESIKLSGGQPTTRELTLKPRPCPPFYTVINVQTTPRGTHILLSDKGKGKHIQPNKPETATFSLCPNTEYTLRAWYPGYRSEEHPIKPGKRNESLRITLKPLPPCPKSMNWTPFGVLLGLAGVSLGVGIVTRATSTQNYIHSYAEAYSPTTKWFSSYQAGQTLEYTSTTSYVVASALGATAFTLLGVKVVQDNKQTQCQRQQNEPPSFLRDQANGRMPLTFP